MKKKKYSSFDIETSENVIFYGSNSNKSIAISNKFLRKLKRKHRTISDINFRKVSKEFQRLGINYKKELNRKNSELNYINNKINEVKLNLPSEVIDTHLLMQYYTNHFNDISGIPPDRFDNKNDVSNEKTISQNNFARVAKKFIDHSQYGIFNIENKE